MVVVTLQTVPRYDSTRTQRWGAHAVVVGAGMAGLAAARVLADGFDEVTVVERDVLSDDPAPRRTVPQSAHIHVMMVAGQQTLEDLCPGYGADLLSAGGLADLAGRFFERAAPTVDLAWNMAVGADHRFRRTAGPKPRGTDLLNRYLARLLRTAHADGVLADAFFRVQMMERPPTTLFRPGVVWRVLRPT